MQRGQDSDLRSHSSSEGVQHFQQQQQPWSCGQGQQRAWISPPVDDQHPCNAPKCISGDCGWGAHLGGEVREEGDVHLLTLSGEVPVQGVQGTFGVEDGGLIVLHSRAVLDPRRRRRRRRRGRKRYLQRRAGAVRTPAQWPRSAQGRTPPALWAASVAGMAAGRPGREERGVTASPSPGATEEGAWGEPRWGCEAGWQQVKGGMKPMPTRGRGRRRPLWDGEGAYCGSGLVPMVGQGRCPQRVGAPRQPAGRRPRSTYQQPAKGGSVYPLTDFFLLTQPGSCFHPNLGALRGTASPQPLDRPRSPSPGPAAAFGCGPGAALPAAVWLPGMRRGGAQGGDDAGGIARLGSVGAVPV